MAVKKYKALNLLDNKGFWPEKTAIVDAIKEVLVLGQCTKPLPVKDFGKYRDPQWKDDDNNLVPFQSVDWYIFDALNEERMQVDCVRLLKDFTDEPWRDERIMGDHYDLVIIEEDMFDPRGDDNRGRETGYCVGGSQKLTAAVVSTHRLEHIWGMPYGNIKTEVMRQLCFMFGVPEPTRSDVLLAGEQLYCQNTCILRPAQVAPEDWTGLTEERLKHGALCDPCLEDLRNFFASAASEQS